MENTQNCKWETNGKFFERRKGCTKHISQKVFKSSGLIDKGGRPNGANPKCNKRTRKPWTHSKSKSKSKSKSTPKGATRKARKNVTAYTEDELMELEPMAALYDYTKEELIDGRVDFESTAWIRTALCDVIHRILRVFTDFWDMEKNNNEEDFIRNVACNILYVIHENYIVPPRSIKRLIKQLKQSTNIQFGSLANELESHGNDSLKTLRHCRKNTYLRFVFEPYNKQTH